MSNESNQRRLTPQDPVPPETLKKMEELEFTLNDMARTCLALDHEKIKYLAASKRVDEEREKLFQTVLMERGLPPNAQVQIDQKTGVLTVAPQQQQPPAPPPVATPATQ